MRLALGALAIAAAALISVEVVMQPSGADRLTFLGIVVAALLISAGTGVGLERSARRLSSLRAGVLTMTLATIGLVAALVGASAGLMFLSPHDLRVMLIALVLAVGLGIILSTSWTNGLRDDLLRLRNTTDQVAAGNLRARTESARPDEIGELARAFDAMAGRLEEATASRAREEAARRSFLAAVSHDLRTPLTAMRVALEALEDGMAPEPDRYLRSLSRDVDALSRLVDDLFLLSRIEAGRLEFTAEPVDVAELVDEAIEALRPIAERERVRVLLSQSGDTQVVAGPAELGRVVRNLLDNAIRHAPPDSAVNVSVGRRNGTVGVSVTDEGPGFPADFRSSAIRQFARADTSRSRNQGGAGLGLAIARGLIAAHGGSLRLGRGRGGRVWFALPAGEAATVALQPARSDSAR